jgi:uncharacterized protein
MSPFEAREREATHGGLARFAERLPYDAVWAEAFARVERLEALLGPSQEVPSLDEAALRRLTAAFTRLAHRRGDVRVARDAARELRAFASDLDLREQALLHRDLLRGLDPFEALDTWPTENLFSAAERELLGGLEQQRDARRRPAALRWAPGRDVEYGGYVCAIMKVTRQCNLRCVYCHDWRTGPETRMPFEVLAHTVAKLLQSPSHDAVDFVWHGGEPTLIKRRGFLRILALQHRFRAPGQVINNIVQTNGAALSRDWAQFFSDFRFSVNVSLDGPPEIHDQRRPMVSGAGSYAQVREGLALLRREGLAKSVLIVVGQELVELGARALIEFLQREDILQVGLLPVRPSNPPGPNSGPYLANDRYMQFLLEVHRARSAAPTPWITVRELDSLLDASKGSMPRHCELLGACVGHYFSVEANGDVAHCDKYVGDARYTVGNVLHSDFAVLRAGAALARVRTTAEQSLERMRACPYFARCRGWCPHERYVAERMNLGVAADCCGMKSLIEALDQERS